MATNALEIWKELSQWSVCLDAVNFFDNKNFAREDVLEKGSVDFDNPRNRQEKEEEIYRAAYYCSSKGYMNMHIEQNQIALGKYLQKSNLMKGKILFIDFGCGPMTSGLVLADILDSYEIKRSNIYYLGIDISKNMCEFAKSINDKYKIFESSMILTTNKLDISQVRFSPDIAILCFSFTLAPNTLKGDGSHSRILAQSWHGIFKVFENCHKSIAIYQNPCINNPLNPGGGFTGNWDDFKAELNRLGPPDKIRYTGGEVEKGSAVSSKQRSLAMASITGER